ncbi:BTB/POZ domain-containing protein 2 isoform X2 [Nilaparvata lugens]|uniref:BTB/POZ domain-containing protein 2 isoform X2 n=1 Tax=Nilaparvata lugens TaxID=108931 RepID=UPI00193CBF21|nr:BTB/POZ domain-containing protein 2 isoform X2 [Nilaparvata lugens]
MSKRRAVMLEESEFESTNMGSKAGENQEKSCSNKEKSVNSAFETRFHRLLKSNMLCDCEFVVGEQKTVIKGHKLLFSLASEVFQAMFCGDLKETASVQVIDLEPEGFNGMKTYIYTGEIKFTSVFHALHTHTAARKYIIPNLPQKCVDFIEKTLKPCDVLELQDTCRINCISDFDNLCSRIINQNTGEVFSSAYFPSASIDAVESILKSSSLNVKSEVEIFINFERWASAEIERRKAPTEDVAMCFNNLKKHIRFLTMSGEEFVERVEPSPLLTREEKYAIAINKMKLNPRVTAESISMIQEPRAMDFNIHYYKHKIICEVVNNKFETKYLSIVPRRNINHYEIEIRVECINSARSIELGVSLNGEIYDMYDDQYMHPGSGEKKVMIIESKFSVLSVRNCNDLSLRNQNERVEQVLHFQYIEEDDYYHINSKFPLLTIQKDSLNANHYFRDAHGRNVIKIEALFSFTFDGIEIEA